MNHPVNVFVTESNVDIYLSKAYACMDADQRDVLLRLVADEESRMGASRAHMENNQRRVEDCRERVRRQRELVGSLQSKASRIQAEFVLETCERMLVLMERHQRLLIERFHRDRL
jgi:hypothetical protein